jgi:hypothetical protein
VAWCRRLLLGVLGRHIQGCDMMQADAEIANQQCVWFPDGVESTVTPRRWLLWNSMPRWLDSAAPPGALSTGDGCFQALACIRITGSKPQAVTCE